MGTTVILGIDPGARTGLALVRVGPSGPHAVLRVCSVADDDVVHWMRQLFQSDAPDGLAIEDWEHQGARRSRGAMHQGFHAGRCAGMGEVFGVTRIALVRRREVLTAFGVRTEAALHDRVRLLSALGGRHATTHELDAIAVAIVGAGRMGPLYAGDRFRRTPRTHRARKGQTA